MAIPTFDGESLFTKSAVDSPGAATARFQTEHLPGVDGEFVQGHGLGAREIVASGWLESAGATPAAAHAALKTLLRSKQALVDGQTVATYVGTDAHDYDHCILTSYELRDVAQALAAGGSFRAVVPVEATLRQVAP